MSVLVRNEKRKYLATALNNLAVASIVTGGIAPLAGVLTGALHLQTLGLPSVAAGAWLLIGVLLMFGARQVLEKLE